MNITYHIVPKKYFNYLNESQDYLPVDFAKEGFIHCTDGEYMMSTKAVQYFPRLEDELLILFIDKDKVKSKIQYDDAAQLFPHIYGPLNRDSIVKIAKMQRDRKGDWIFPIQEML